MRHVIIGTAGHVDHGKSALIRALTGIETDRLKEEKERGLSIELGFAYFDLPDGLRAGIVDVPGHEKFIRNMLSGAYGMDIVLLVVDAKEGVQEQTFEHLEIIDLLGISIGILVITKLDLVDANQLEESTEMSREMLVGTTLEGSPTVAVSNITGEGIDQLKQTIVDQVKNATKEEFENGIPRLYVDRIFIMSGFGAIVTGTLVGGIIQQDQRMKILPGRNEVRVRGIQVHNEPTVQALPGQRTAINLSNVTETISRGDVLCPMSLSETTDNIDVSIKVLISFPRILEHWTRLRFYTGTRESLCRMVMLTEEAIFPNDEALIQLRLEEPILAFRGDRFILRDFSAQCTVGGGWIVNPFAPRHKRFTDQTLETLNSWAKVKDPEKLIHLILEHNENLCVSEDLIRYYLSFTDQAFKNLFADLEKVGKILRWKGSLPSVSSFARTQQIGSQLMEMLRNFHEQQPLALGQNFSQLRLQLELNEFDFEKIIDYLISKNQMVKDGNLIRLSSHEISFSEKEEVIKSKIEKIFSEAKLNTPNVTEVTEQLSDYSAGSVNETFYALVNLGKLVKIEEGIFVHKDAIKQIENLLIDYLERHDIITVAEFRELAQTSRKYAVPFLEFCDSIGLTVRNGNYRRLRNSC
ncbi:TPA: selenocysteine-specific translation elongation factor [Candidatus Poribacteria bacterium]|nr:selenocysteine-specific translation elongation factor [Candidatus Poribacteria bacterium]HIO05615.1 selenocysteine-specific translation elongation factor [Candidatus Poribacteria bacterium]